jgi:hypothetical protein
MGLSPFIVYELMLEPVSLGRDGRAAWATRSQV